MENFYKKLDERKQYVKGFASVTSGDYEVLFLGKFMPDIIDYFIENAKIENLDLQFGVYFKKRNYDSKPEMKIDGRSIYFSVNEYRYFTLIGSIIEFFKKVPGTFDWAKGNMNYDDGIEVSTTLLDLIETYKNNLPGLYDEKELDAQSRKAEVATESLNNLLSDEVHAKNFEEKFLDKYVAAIIQRNIDAITHRNNVEKAEDGYPVYAKVNINFTSYPADIICMDEKLEASFADTVKSFMKFYDLGTVEYLNGFRKIEFNTTLDKLMDAYYMEKQRIEYLTSGAKEAYSNDKKITM